MALSSDASQVIPPSLHDALTVVHESLDDYSPAGLALEVARAIDAAHPECMGAFGHLADAVICREGAILKVLDDIVQAYITTAAMEQGLLD